MARVVNELYWIPEKLRSFTPLLDFVAYCVAHPDERFWQALRNWSGYNFVLVSNAPPLDYKLFRDTFYLEGKHHDE